jgi:hypothetical protein
MKRAFDYFLWAVANPMDFIRDIIGALALMCPYVFDDDQDQTNEWDG